MKARSAALVALLVASAALNAALLAKRDAATPHLAETARIAVRCSALERCRAAAAQSWGTLAAPAPAPPRRADDAPPSRAPTPPAVAPAASEVDRVLCEMGADELREKWQRDKEGIVTGLRRSLTDPAGLLRDEARELDEAAAALGLDAGGKDAFATPYLRLRRDAVDALVDALDEAPPDLGAVHDLLAQFFQDEDALVQRLYGDDALARYQRSQLRSRTALLAIASSVAGIPWDDGVAW